MQVIYNVTVYPVNAAPIKKGAVAFTNGKVIACGLAENGPESISTEVAAAIRDKKASLIDGKNGSVTPGLIDAHTHLGIHEEGVGIEGADDNETTDPITPDLRAIDGIYPGDVAINDALQAGITTACVLPGSANVINGQAVAIHTYGRVVDDMVVSTSVGMKVAFGENPKRVYKNKDKTPATRMAIAALLRSWLAQASSYAYKKQRAIEKGEPYDIDTKLEALLPVIKGTIPLRAHAHRTDDIVTAVRVAQEFGVGIVLEHCTEGHLIADFLAKNNIPVVIGPSFSTRLKVELREKTFATPGILAQAGITVCIMTDHPITSAKYLPLMATLSVKAGMSEEEALKAITLHPARILGLENRLGSIETGKDADLVLWSGHPLDIKTTVQRVWIAGKQVL